MRIHATHDVGMRPEAVRAWLAEPESWRALPGVEEVRPEAREVRLLIRGPRRIALRLAVEATAAGVRAELVEGDLKALWLEATVHARGKRGSRIELELELVAPYPLPGPLAAELEQVTVHRWLAAVG